VGWWVVVVVGGGPPVVCGRAEDGTGNAVVACTAVVAVDLVKHLAADAGDGDGVAVICVRKTRFEEGG
jgi:hypothetical protein